MKSSAEVSADLNLSLMSPESGFEHDFAKLKMGRLILAVRSKSALILTLMALHALQNNEDGLGKISFDFRKSFDIDSEA